jgi:hypothetical protein
MFTKNPDRREAAAAVARGFGAPVLYELTKKKVETWKAKRPAAPTAPTQPAKPKEPAGGLPIA